MNNGAKPGGRAVDVAKLQKLVKDQGFLIDGGYGKIKGTTFRISNMGDETEAHDEATLRRAGCSDEAGFKKGRGSKVVLDSGNWQPRSAAGNRGIQELMKGRWIRGGFRCPFQDAASLTRNPTSHCVALACILVVAPNQQPGSGKLCTLRG